MMLANAFSAVGIIAALQVASVRGQEWTRIASCSGGNSLGFESNIDRIQRMAETSTRVRICTRRDGNDCITSQPNTYPILNLRQGIMLLSHMNGERPCNEQCMRQFWSGSDSRLQQLSVSCGNTQQMNMRSMGGNIMWGCNTTGGLHFGWDDACGWDWKDGWYDGGIHRSCTAGCNAHGLQCTEQKLYENNGDVDSDEEFINLIRDVGGSVQFANCNSDYGYNWDVPAWQPGLCYRAAPNRGLNSFRCGAVVPQYGKHRMCYCHTDEQQATGLEIFLDYRSAAPTTSPTVGPTAWYQHSDHAGTNTSAMAAAIEVLESQVANLQRTCARQVDVDAELSQVSAQLVIVQEENAAQDSDISAIRNAIRSAVALVPGTSVSLPSPSRRTQSSPTVEASGVDVSIKAPSGAVQLESDACGVYDPCLSKLVLANITAALNSLAAV